MTMDTFEILMARLGFTKSEENPERWVRELGDLCKVEFVDSESEDCGLDFILKDMDGKELCRAWGEWIEDGLANLRDKWDGKVDVFRDMQDDIHELVQDLKGIIGR